MAFPRKSEVETPESRYIVLPFFITRDVNTRAGTPFHILSSPLLCTYLHLTAIRAISRTQVVTTERLESACIRIAKHKTATNINTSRMALATKTESLKVTEEDPEALMLTV